MRPEDILSSQISQYLKAQYKNVIFRYDLAAGMVMTISMATRNKKIQKCNGYPDLFIAEPRKGYAGLYVELKTSRDEVFNKNGTIKANEHIREQANMLALLNDKGYKAEFGFGFDHTKKIIDEYLK